MKKVAIFFANDRGRYYIEVAVAFEGEDIPKTDRDYVLTKVIDESKDWRLYKETSEELANPTTEDGEVFVVIQAIEKAV